MSLISNSSVPWGEGKHNGRQAGCYNPVNKSDKLSLGAKTLTISSAPCKVIICDDKVNDEGALNFKNSFDIFFLQWQQNVIIES